MTADPAPPVTVLHVDADPERRAAVRASLEAAGHRVVQVEDGTAASGAAARARPGLVLLGFGREAGEDEAVAVLLRSLPALDGVPLVALAPAGHAEGRRAALVAGCDGCIPTPLDPASFPSRVAEFLAGRRERVAGTEAREELHALTRRLAAGLVRHGDERRRLLRRFARRAAQLEALHHALQEVTAELGVEALLRRLLPTLAEALGARRLDVALATPALTVAAGDASAAADAGPARACEVEWALPLIARGRRLGTLTARLVLPDGGEAAAAEEEQFLRVVADQVAIAVENARLYERVAQRAAEAESLVEAGRLLASTLELSRVLHRLAELVQGRLATDCVVRIWLREFGATGVFCLHAQAGTTREPPPSRVRVLADEGLIGGVVYRRAPVVVEDLAHDPRVRNRDRVREEGLVSFLGVPLLLEDMPVGILTVATRARRAFAPEEVALVEALARSAAVAIWNARLYEETQDRLRQTETLLAVARAVASTLDAGEVTRRTLEALVHALGADRGGAWLLAPEGDRLLPLAGYRLPRARLEHAAGAGAGVAATVRALTEPVPSGDGDAGHAAARALLGELPDETSIVAPIRLKGETIGALAVLWSGPREVRREELRLVDGIVHQAAAALENARLLEAERRARAEATRRRREAEELARLARMLTESLDAADVGQRIVESARQLLGGRCAVLRLLEPDGSLKLIAANGEPAVAAAVPVLPPGAGLAGRVVATGAAAWSADVLAEADLARAEPLDLAVAALNLRAVLAVPLRVKRQILGVILVADDAGRIFADTEVALLQTFADQAAIALENSRLYGDLRAALRAVEESQQRIVQGERLRALGEMAGGVAHDFNNVLAIIVGRAEVLLSETDDPELQRQLRVIVKVALDAAQTVRRIQEFTRVRPARPFQPVRLDQLVAEVVEVTRSRWKDEAQGRGITYDVLVDAAPTPPVAGDPSELREALTNILFNALDAMPEGGTVTLRTAVEGERVVCAVTDTGVGMTEEVRQRIFDPFFTTKGERGTGLGLSVVYGIVTRHAAEIEVQSAPGRGTTFLLRFPVAREPLPAAPPPAPPARGGARRAARVLVVDDEREVGEVLREVLARDGHEVVICTDGERASAELARGAFDLVLTDLGMPGISGWDVARLAKQRAPEVPVAMVTGWSDRIDPVEAAARGVDAVLAKPFTRDQVRALVERALSPGARFRAAAG